MDNAWPDNLLQRPHVRSIMPRPHAPASWTEGNSTYRARLEDIRELPAQDISADRSACRVHAGSWQYKRHMRTVPAGGIRLPCVRDTKPACRDRQHTMPETLSGSAHHWRGERTKNKPYLMAPRRWHRQRRRNRYADIPQKEASSRLLLR